MKKTAFFTICVGLILLITGLLLMFVWGNNVRWVPGQTEMIKLSERSWRYDFGSVLSLLGVIIGIIGIILIIRIRKQQSELKKHIPN